MVFARQQTAAWPTLMWQQKGLLESTHKLGVCLCYPQAKNGCRGRVCVSVEAKGKGEPLQAGIRLSLAPCLHAFLVMNNAHGLRIN